MLGIGGISVSNAGGMIDVAVPITLGNPGLTVEVGVGVFVAVGVGDGVSVGFGVGVRTTVTSTVTRTVAGGWVGTGVGSVVGVGVPFLNKLHPEANITKRTSASIKRFIIDLHTNNSYVRIVIVYPNSQV